LAREPKGEPQFPHLVLVERGERLDDETGGALLLHKRGAHIVMGLDEVGLVPHPFPRLDEIGITASPGPGKESRMPSAPISSSWMLMKRSPMMRLFCSGSATPARPA